MGAREVQSHLLVCLGVRTAAAVNLVVSAGRVTSLSHGQWPRAGPLRYP